MEATKSGVPGVDGAGITIIGMPEMGVFAKVS
jgi:hypothetical protein